MDARVGAVTAIAADHGLRVDDPVVLRDRSNLLVHLRPVPVVARVAAQTTVVRHGGAWLGREVLIAGFLADRGAPVVAPSPLLPPGPHRRDGFTISFWTFVREVGGVDATEAGRGLRRCHDLLRDLGRPLPRWGVLREVERILDRLERTEALDAEPVRARLHALEARIDAAALPEQPVHGDAHLGNVLQTPDGPRWTDWEDAFTGPVGWDLACLLASAAPHGTRDPAAVRAAVAATGHAVPPGAMAALVDARRLQVAAWTVVLGRARGDAAMAERGLRHLAG